MSSGDERRVHRRYKLWVPARIEGSAGGSQLAIGHDISEKGSLMVTRPPGPEVGSTIRIFVRVPPDAEEERMVTARVLRVSPNEADPGGLWPLRMAVEFNQADPELARIVETFADEETDDDGAS